MTRKKRKITCDNCGKEYNISGVILYGHKFLCGFCKPKVFNIPMPKTLQNIKKSKDLNTRISNK